MPSDRSPYWLVQRRCFWYTDDGTPRERARGGEGCPHPDGCSYAHPWQHQDWDTAKPGGRPPAHFLAARGRSRSRSPPPRMRSRSPPPRPRSPPPRRRTRSPLSRRSRSPLRKRSSRSPHRSPPPVGPRIPTGPRIGSSSFSRSALRRSPSRGRSESGKRANVYSRSRSHDRGGSPYGPHRLSGRPPYIPRNREAVQDSRSTEKGNVASGSGQGKRDRASSIASSSADNEKPAVANTVSKQDTPSEPGQISETIPVVPYIKQEPVSASLKDPRPRPVQAESAPPTPVASAALGAPALSSPAGRPLPPNQSPSAPIVLGAHALSPPPNQPPSAPAALKWKPVKIAMPSTSNGKSASDSPKSRPLTAEEKEKLWLDRIDLLNNTGRLRRECIKLKEEKHHFDRLLARPDLVSDDDRPDIEARRTQREAAYAAKEAELQRSVLRLAECIYWPAQSGDAPPPLAPDASLILGAQISEIRSVMDEIRGLLAALDARQREIRMSEENLDSLSGQGADTEGDVRMGAQKPVNETGVSRAELEEVLKRFDDIEDKLAGAQNEIVQQHDDIMDEISATISQRFEEMNISASSAQAQPGVADQPTIEQKLQAAQEELQATGRDIDSLVEEVTDLYGRMEVTTKENNALKAENLALKAERDILLQSIATMKSREDECMQRVENGLRAVTHAMSEHMARPAPPVMDTNAVIQYSLNMVTQHLRTHLTPQMAELKDEVDQKLTDQNNAIWTDVAHRLQKTAEIMETIQEWATRAGVGLLGATKS